MSMPTILPTGQLHPDLFNGPFVSHRYGAPNQKGCARKHDEAQNPAYRFFKTFMSMPTILPTGQLHPDLFNGPFVKHISST